MEIVRAVDKPKAPAPTTITDFGKADISFHLAVIAYSPQKKVRHLTCTETESDFSIHSMPISWRSSPLSGSTGTFPSEISPIGNAIRLHTRQTHPNFCMIPWQDTLVTWLIREESTSQDLTRDSGFQRAELVY